MEVVLVTSYQQQSMGSGTFGYNEEKKSSHIYLIFESFPE